MKAMKTVGILAMMVLCVCWTGWTAQFILEPEILPDPTAGQLPCQFPLNDYDQDGFTFTIEDDAGPVVGTLNNAILQANANPGPDTIIIPASGGQWPKPNPSYPPPPTHLMWQDIQDSVTIEAAPGAEVVIDLGGGSIPDLVGENGLTIRPGAGGKVILKNLTIQNVKNARGIMINSGDVSIVNCTIRDIHADPAVDGSGIYIQGSLTGSRPNVIIDGCRIYGCATTGIHAHLATVQIQNTEISRCGDVGIEVEWGTHVDAKLTSIINNDRGVFINPDGHAYGLALYECDISLNASHGIDILNAPGAFLSLDNNMIAFNGGWGINDPGSYLGNSYEGCDYGINLTGGNTLGHFFPDSPCPGHPQYHNTTF